MAGAPGLRSMAGATCPAAVAAAAAVVVAAASVRRLRFRAAPALPWEDGCSWRAAFAVGAGSSVGTVGAATAAALGGRARITLAAGLASASRRATGADRRDLGRMDDRDRVGLPAGMQAPQGGGWQSCGRAARGAARPHERPRRRGRSAGRARDPVRLRGSCMRGAGDRVGSALPEPRGRQGTVWVPARLAPGGTCSSA
jgi:hypothetical protein